MVNRIILALSLSLVATTINAQHWSFPGDIKSHLRSEHSITDVSNLTSEEMLDLHDALHVSKSKRVPTIVMYSSDSCGLCRKWFAEQRHEWKRVGWFVRKVTDIDLRRPLPWFRITDSDGLTFEVYETLTRDNFLAARRARLSAKRMSMLD